MMPIDSMPTTRSPTVSPPEGEFTRMAAPLRSDLLAHCYRMLGSVHDAEDAVQETYVRAWRAYDRFDGRSSLRTWLYTIATRACLRSIEQSKRRALPSGIGSPTDDPINAIGAARTEVPWLEPLPTGDPAGSVERRSDLRLAFVATLQLLPARQRVALILREVLDWSAGEIAELLETSPAGANSLLQRARATLSKVSEHDFAEPDQATARALLDGYANAFENADIDALLEVLTQDAVWEMPPYSAWFTGRERIVEFLRSKVSPPGQELMLPVEANHQPALASYLRRDDGKYEAHSLHVLTLSPTGISRVVAFIHTTMLPKFGRPQILEHDFR
jgi:RNA polymerase sigma-70 factor (ECF subfamily)